MEARTAENIAAGMAPEEAAREARMRFGNARSVREDCREARGVSWGESLWQDLRFGLRMLRKEPGFTIVAALTLGLGIGANAAIFSMLKPLLYHSLPYPDGDRLVRVYRTAPQSQSWEHSRADFLDHREQNHVFSFLAAYMWEGFNFSPPGLTPERLTAVHVTADFFPMLGIRPALGRVFSREEMDGDQVTVLSHKFWESHLNGDTNAVGQTLRFDGEPVRIIGVMPASFDFPILWGHPDVWRPLLISASEREDRENRFLNIIGRLKPGVPLSTARADMSALAGRLARDYPQYDGGTGLRVVTLEDSLQPDAINWLWFLLCLTSFVLLIACANLANLQLARTARRLRELAVRAAFGATRNRLLRQLLTESLLISIFGAALGLLFAWWCDALMASNLEAGFKTALDSNVILFALASCVVTTIAFGAAPAWLAVHADLNEKLKETVRGATHSRSQQRIQQLLIVGEVALVLMLLTGASSILQILHRFGRIDPGWDMHGLLTANVTVSKAKYSTDESRFTFFRQLEELAATLPGVQSASFATDIPLVRYWNTQPLLLGGQPVPPRREIPLASCPTVGADYFRTFGIPLREGRPFTPDDKLDRPLVVLVNESLARRFWPGQSAIGKKLTIGDPTNPQWREIVGVVGNVRFPADADPPETFFHVYRPWTQDDLTSGGIIVLRTSDRPDSTAIALRNALAKLDPDLPLNSVRTVRQAIDYMMRGIYRLASLLGAFGALGLALSTVGIYGVTSYSMARRTVEIGVRMALGARRPDVLWLVLRQGLKLGALGALLGLGGAFAVMRIIAAMIPSGSPMCDPSTFFSVPVSGWVLALSAAAILIIVTLLACYFPARRAANVNPMAALRSE